MKVLVFGGSANIGYYSAQRLLDSGATVYFQLRRPNAFDNDEAMQKYITSGKAVIVEGDALKADDVRRAFEKATADGPIDVCIFTVGGKPTIKITKGAVVTPHNLCTVCMLNVLAAMPRDPAPKFICLSSTGLTKASHKALPTLFKPMYGWLLRYPHQDKLGMERIAAHAAGWEWKDEEIPAGILPEGWEGQIPAGFEKNVLVVRAAMLTDGQCKADTKGNSAYRNSKKELTAYTVSRRDVAYFIVEQALKNWENYGNSIVNVGY